MDFRMLRVVLHEGHVAVRVVGILEVGLLFIDHARGVFFELDRIGADNQTGTGVGGFIRQFDTGGFVKVEQDPGSILHNFLITIFNFPFQIFVLFSYSVPSSAVVVNCSVLAENFPSIFCTCSLFIPKRSSFIPV
ncbi:hypothetical protein [Lihuaxuella thermophila]|uniref:hypothetical protein n=1 Tax=Lihuaxuella thermophila TaxID=1173111 RepID=UPI00147F6CA4|nr:hypothetical protein [Lihuaxuella thermophila]